MQTDERRLGDANEGIIDLEVKEGLHTLLAHVIQTAWPAFLRMGGQGGQGSAMSVRRKGKAIFRGHENLACRLVKRRHLPLSEKPEPFQAEALVLLEEVDGRLVVLGAGHDVERDGFARTRLPRATIFSA